MESSLLVDHQSRRLTTGRNFNSGSNSSAFSTSQSLTLNQQQQLLLQNQSGGGGNIGGFGFFGSPRPPPFFPNFTPPIPQLSTRSSLPPISHFRFQSQPSCSAPLLPLPYNRSQSLPSTYTSQPVMPHRKGSSSSTQRRTKSSSGSRRKPSRESGSNPTTSTSTPLPPIPVPPVRKAKLVEVEEQKEEGEIDDYEEKVVYSLSPPPSSLPLPTFTLRPRNGVACNAEALGVRTKAGGGDRKAEVSNGTGASTADDLRRLFRP